MFKCNVKGCGCVSVEGTFYKELEVPTRAKSVAERMFVNRTRNQERTYELSVPNVDGEQTTYHTQSWPETS